MPILLVFIALITSHSAWAYPKFIGYKYSSCLTCHFNAQGNGPLNDYGRALWAAEIAGRLWSGGRSDEQLGEASGFAGSKPMPWWLRPGFKTRFLNVQEAPGSANASSRFIVMQAEANAAVFLDQNQTKTFVASFGYVPVPRRIAIQQNAAKPPELISREHYFRWQAKENLWMYFGMLDKVYGIRHANHTAFSRTKTGVSMNDQSHSIIAQYIQPKWEGTVDLFLGNFYQASDLRQAGLSGMYEYEPAPEWRIGVSALYSSNKYVKNQRLGLHSRSGFGYGSAILLELGLIDDVPSSATAKHGYYLYSEGIQRLSRGYHFFVVGQAYKDAMIDGRPDLLRAGLGLLMFPMQRLELRVELESERQLSTQEIRPDTWAILTQMHISL